MRRAVLWNRWRTLGPGVALAIFIPAYFVAVRVVVPVYMDREKQDSPLRNERGVVVRVMPASATRGNWAMREMVTVRVGRIEMSGVADTPLREGEEVLVSYRLAKSGRVYFEYVRPLAL